MGKKTLKGKMVSTSLFISLTALVLITAVTIIIALIMKANAIQDFHKLSDDAAANSQEILIKEAKQSLMDISSNKAEVADVYFSKFQNYVSIIANAATVCYTNPEKFAKATVNLPDPANAGKFSTQLVLADGVRLEDVQDEIGVIGNSSGALELIAKYDDSVFGTHVATDSGISILVDMNSNKKGVSLNPKTRTWYQDAVKENGRIWTDVYDDVLGGGLSITCAEPFYDKDGNIVGVAGIDSFLTDLNTIILDTTIGDTGYAFIVNEKGQTIVSPKIEKNEKGEIIRENLLSSENPDVRKVAWKMIDGETGITALTYEDREVFVAYTQMQTVPWSVATIIDVEEILAPANESKNQITELAFGTETRLEKAIFLLCIMVAFVFILVAFFTFFISRKLASRLSRPIAELTEGVKKISLGDLNYKINIKTDDEIETLAGTFNEMTDRLQVYVDSLAAAMFDKERNHAELVVAKKIQQSMLPNTFPAFPDYKDFEIYAKMQPAKLVGGDFYDYSLIDDSNLIMLIADVSGKGVPAAMFMIVAKTLIANYAKSGISPEEIMYNVNNQLCENNDESMFVTAFIGLLNFKTGVFTYSNAGHNPPLIYHSGRGFDWLDTDKNVFLGGKENFKYTSGKLVLGRGDSVFLYTDGITEAMNADGEFYSKKRLINALNEKEVAPMNPKEILEYMKGKLIDFTVEAEQVDDITMLIAKLN
ncbi:MAG: SpoIIE family protein phosphatase [Oscillospiraceae bacterium]